MKIINNTESTEAFLFKGTQITLNPGDISESFMVRDALSLRGILLQLPVIFDNDQEKGLLLTHRMRVHEYVAPGNPDTEFNQEEDQENNGSDDQSEE
jgi:hypothetical protein